MFQTDFLPMATICRECESIYTLRLPFLRQLEFIALPMMCRRRMVSRCRYARWFKGFPVRPLAFLAVRFDGREQNSLLWQQLSATAALLEPAHSALHGPSAAAAATGNDSGNPSGQALDHSADTEGGRQTAPQETPKAEPGNP